MKMKEMKTVMVHGGVFHCDDAMVVAIMKRINPDINVVRTNRVPEDVGDDVLVADIGGGYYDHHQADAERRASGEKYAACGLVLRDCWEDIFPTEEEYKRFDEDYIVPIELTDNGVSTNPLSLAVSSFNPNWDSDENADDAFMKAVDLLSGVLDREVEAAESRQRAVGIVQDALDASDGAVVVLPQFAPWQSVLCPSTAKFVIFPSNRGGYNLQVVPIDPADFAAKQDLPAEWLEDKPEGCTFVHPGRFLAAFDTKDEAVTAAESLVG